MAAKKKVDVCDNFKIVKSTDGVIIDFLVKDKWPDRKIERISDPFSEHYRFSSKTFLTQAKKCFICDNVDVFLDNENAWDMIKSGQFMNGHSLILYCDKLDARSKFSKQFKEYIFEVSDKIDPASIIKEAENFNSRFDLYEKCNRSLSRFKNEFDKITWYGYGTNKSLDEIYEELCNENSFVFDIDNNTFTVLNAIMTKQPKIAYSHISDFNSYDFGLSTLLYNNFRNLYIHVYSAMSGIQTNFSPFVKKNLSLYEKVWNPEKIIDILKLIQQIDSGVKSGDIDGSYALDYLLAGVFSYA